MPARAPVQKEKRSAKIPLNNPNNQPIPKLSLASPRPIQLPRDTSHINAKNPKKIKPVIKS